MNRKEAMRQTHQMNVLQSLGFTADEAEALRRISMTLRRWFELECGDGNGCIEREQVQMRDWECSCGHKFSARVKLSKSTPNLSGEATQFCPKCGKRPAIGSPVYWLETGKALWRNAMSGNAYRIPDRETGARKRLAKILAVRNARNYVQGTDYYGECVLARDELNAYIQTDPRGAALYILRPGDVPEGADVSAYYSRGICVY